MTTLSRTSSPGGRPDGPLGLTSPPGPGRISRRGSEVSSIGGPSPSVNGGQRKPRAGRNRLRDYYGLAGSAPKGDPMDLGQSTAARLAQRCNSRADIVELSCLDSTAFDPAAYFDHLANNASLPELLKRENELLTGELHLRPCEARTSPPRWLTSGLGTLSPQRFASSTVNASPSSTTTTTS